MGRRIGGLGLAAGVAVPAGLLAALPLLLTATGIVEVAASLRGAWDPTWNDGDLWFALMGTIALVLLMAVSGAGGYAGSRVSRMRAVWLVPAAIAASLAIAAATAALVMSRMLF